ncbi:PEPxxWA-CTERM sorting domain-containing protein [uncultured Sphingomonas sp.]|uniref:PEPxxWA-CTERM sorting domain-containing protein n=1 Tax=uncultured Sphingomonas sp. TaxID=158754 RepID=UPI0025F7C286|nr:PEPxxWA-CTERM sorting domain-containing protein [uncultured Sphingomonas sp.]
MKKFLLAAILATCGIADANAAPLIWTLHDVRFVDGGTAEGWLSFDSDAGKIGDFAITVSAGTDAAFTAATYSSSNTNSVIFDNSTLGIDHPGKLYLFRMKDSNRQFRIAADGLPPASGGSIDLIHTAFTGECFACYPWRGFSNLGSITSAAVPEPATWAMMLLGFGMVGAAARRRRQHIGVSFS